MSYVHDKSRPHTNKTLTDSVNNGTKRTMQYKEIAYRKNAPLVLCLFCYIEEAQSQSVHGMILECSGMNTWSERSKKSFLAHTGKVAV